jgi:hypothetical protein
MQAAEEHARALPVLRLGHRQRRGIDALVGPMIVIGKLPEAFDAHFLLILLRRGSVSKA